MLFNFCCRETYVKYGNVMEFYSYSLINVDDGIRRKFECFTKNHILLVSDVGQALNIEDLLASC